jgi:LPS-assembly protein
MITNCRLPAPWWTLRGPTFDIIPGDRAIARSATFRVKSVPLFYTPRFYKSLADRPRKSGFLMPNIGNSSRRGKMIGVGYYWAFHRSYDLMYRSQLFTQRGFAHHADFRGKPTAESDFNFILYGVNDRGAPIPNSEERIKQGGYLWRFDGRTALPWGFQARGEVNYLSSFVFRQAFTESFQEVVQSQVNSIGYATRQWDTHAFSVVMARSENYQSSAEGDRIVIRRLPAVEYSSRDRKLFGNLPVWGSIESSFGLLRRNQPLFQTRQFVNRADFAPRVSTALRWKDFSLLPSFAIRETHYGSSFRDGAVTGDGVLRSAREFTVDLITPSLARVFSGPGWLGESVKHVIEPRAGFRWVGGVHDFDRYIRFDETELLANTKEMDVSLTNRLYAKRGGAVHEVLAWQLWMKHYFDPTLGGAVVDGARNVFLTQTEMTGYAFFSGPRRWSPVVSSLLLNPLPSFGIEWRSDFDTRLHRVTNSSLVGSFRKDRYTIMAGHNHARSAPTLSPPANQFIGQFGWSRSDQRGWSAGFQALYDFRTSVMQFATTQVSYNSDCCGLSVQFRRINAGVRNENQFRAAFVVSNIGSFGTLRPQDIF